MELKQPQVNPYAPVLERKEQLRMELPQQPLRPAKPPVSQPAAVQAAPSRAVRPEGQLSRPSEEPLSLRDSAVPAKDLSGFSGYLERVLDATPQPEPNTPVLRVLETPSQQQVEPTPAETPEAPPLPVEEAPTAPLPKAPLREFHSRVIGEAFGTYLIVEYSQEELMFIDKHAAHERLLYERLKRENAGGEAQTLLEPVTVTLDKEEYSAVLSHLEDFSKAGFEVEDFGAGTVLVRSAPLLLDGQDAAESVMEIAGYLASMKNRMTTEHLDWVYHNVACRAAMKAGDSITREEMISLAQELEENPDVRYCPHGRPVYILLRRRDVERQFGRV